MYDVSFTKLSERFFKGASWPTAEIVSELVDNDHVFLLLYKVCPRLPRHLKRPKQPTIPSPPRRS